MDIKAVAAQVVSGAAAVTIPRAKAAATLAAAGQESALVLRDFLPFGGEVRAMAPTEARLVWDDQALHVLFRCTEPNPRYAPVTGKSGDGLSNPVFADMVAIQIRPSWSDTAWFLIAAASAGTCCAQRYPSWPLPANSAPEPVSGVICEVRREAGHWLARVTVPWSLVGGRPSGGFGISLLRVRGQSAERSSPVALDFTDEPAPDLFMEARLGDKPAVSSLPGTLVKLPSGVRRWQRPAQLVWPTDDERKALWNLQSGLDTPSTPATLAERLYLAQRFLDLLMLEGFSFHPEGGSWTLGAGDYRSEQARFQINEALRSGDDATACRVLDHFLGQLDRAVRVWFVDGSPGNIRDDAWQPLDRISAITSDGNEVHLEAHAGKHAVNLWLSAPNAGSVRLHGETRGFFEPSKSLSGNLSCRGRQAPKASGAGGPPPDCSVGQGATVETERLVITFERDPWSVTVKERDGSRYWRLQQGDLAFRFGADGKIAAIDLRRPLVTGEGIYGLGERYDALDQRGRVLTLWDIDAWEGCFYTLRNHAYKPIPLYHSTAGYSCFFNSSYRLRADVGNANPNQCRFTMHGNVLDLTVWLTEPLQVLQDYTALTGRPVVPPRWAFEPWMGGGWGRWKHGPLKDPVAEMLGVARRFAELDIPHSAIYAEGEGSLDPRLFTGLGPMGIRPLTWMNSNIGLEAQQKLLPDVPESDLPIVRRADGKPFPYIDFTHPRAMELLRAYWKRYLDLGIAGSMVDFGDLVPEDAVFHDGRRGDAMHNQYAYAYHQHFGRTFAERRGDDHVLFSRSAAPGSQRWLCQFAGDHPSNFAGLAGALRGGLNLSACGFSTWGCDIGGYHVWPDPEVYIRWVEWGAFSPMMRCHGTQPREPWEYGDEAVRIYKRYAWIRENLLDYVYSCAVEAHRTGLPLMRALPLAFPGEAHLASCDDAYLFGPDLLVAPVHAAGDSRVVPFPAGRWIDLWSGEVVEGGAVRTVPAPLDRIPVFLRAGALVPVQLNAALRWGESMSRERVRALVVTPPAGSESARVWESPTQGGKLRSKPARRGFRVDLDGCPDIRYVLVYGMTTVAAVKVNGEDLPRLDGAERGACPPGWFLDGARVVVRLPHDVRRRIEFVASS